MTTTKTRRPTRKPLSAEQRAEYAEQRGAAVAEAHAAIAEAVADITSGEEWKRYLAFGARFHHYSFNNVVLMLTQAEKRNMAPLSRIAGFSTWQNLGHPVRKGEHGLRIFAPMTVTIKEGEKGYVPGERRTKMIGFKMVSVFDVQQVTDPETVPDDPTTRLATSGAAHQAPKGLWEGLETLAGRNGYTVRWGDTKPAEGWTDPDKKEIVIDATHRVPEAMGRAVAILIHEVAHMLLHTEPDPKTGDVYDYRRHRGMAETEAEGTAYVVATCYGMDLGQTSAGYVAHWSKGDAEQIVRAGGRIMATARKIIDGTAEFVQD